MSKRPAELPLERDFSGSPASKKARVEDANADGSASGADDVDVQGAAELEAEELEEGEKDPSEILDIDEDAPALSAPKRQSAPMEGYGDLYLDTINRQILDFDFEKLCSVSLSNINVYACLVCGKYFQGRGPKSHAYFHALEVGHHVFINIGTKKVYVLPEGYEVQNKSLEDIKYVVDPHYTKSEVIKLDKEVHDAWDLSGSRYRPGEKPERRLNTNVLKTNILFCRLRRYEQHQSQRLCECCSSTASTRSAYTQFLPPPKLPYAWYSGDRSAFQHTCSQALEPKSFPLTRISTRAATGDCFAIFQALHAHKSGRPSRLLVLVLEQSSPCSGRI